VKAVHIFSTPSTRYSLKDPTGIEEKHGKRPREYYRKAKPNRVPSCGSIREGLIS
jgi:hypothetical protein